MARFRRRTDRWVVPISDLAPDALAEVGVVARGLAGAATLGLPVVPAAVVLATCFSRLQRAELPPGHDIASLLRVIHRPQGVERAALARERLLGAPPEPRLVEDLDEAIQGLAPEPRQGVSILASPALPTWELAHATGLLGESAPCESGAAAASAVHESWARVFGEEALHLLRQHRLRDLLVAAVVIPDGAFLARGWAVSEPRLPGPREATWAVHAVHPGGVAWSCRISGSGEVLADFSRGAAARASWLPELASSLAPAAAVGPVGLPFVASERAVHFTGLVQLSVPREGDRGSTATRWARTTVGAGEPWAPWTALSLGLLTDAARARVQRARAAAGVPLARSDEPLMAQQGRCYVDASALELPADASDLPPSTLQELGGAQMEPSRFVVAPNPAGLARLGIAAARLAADARRLSDAVDRFDRDAEQQRRWLAELDLGILPDDALQTTLREGREFFALSEKLAGDCAASLASADAALLALVARTASGEARRVTFELMAGAGELETARPTLALCHVIEIARRDPAAAGWIATRRLPRGEDGPGARAFRHFLDAFGDLAIGDAELARPRWSEDPSPLISLVESAIQAPSLTPEGLLAPARERASRRRAEIEAGLSFVESRLLPELTLRVRDLLRLRCRLRVRLAHARAMLRTIVLDVDRRLGRLDQRFPALGALDCRFDELVGAVGSTGASLAAIAELRRADRLRLGGRYAPLGFTGSLPAWPRLPSESHTVAGLGVSPGEATGRVRRLDAGSSGSLSKGDVVVVECADLGHAPWMLVAGAFVAEVGNGWSDAAVLARELGIPMVSGVASLGTLLGPGERVRVDGALGTIERLDAGAS